MTTKCPANDAHDSAREEDRRRALAELHAYIDGLERELREARDEERGASEAQAAWNDMRKQRDTARADASISRVERDNAERERDEARRQLRERDGMCETNEAARTKLAYALAERTRERDEARHALSGLRAEIATPAVIAAANVHEAQVQGARWALEEYGLVSHCSREEVAARICAERRGR